MAAVRQDDLLARNKLHSAIDTMPIRQTGLQNRECIGQAPLYLRFLVQLFFY
jgi:hypothetical protein